ncbi:MAG: tetratricopeptide repeat protein, partial [Verrucomicrobiae bacterium]|nr:tetratricopeptide repeat protein [Verrucomicrobiae bacterium]
LWGKNPIGYHVTNILLHAFSCVLLWRVLQRLNIPGAWWAALFFAVHPVNVESVAWISERKNLLALVFFLAAWRAYLLFEAKPNGRRYAETLAWFVLAVLSKSTATVLPVVLLLSALWQRNRLARDDWLRTAPMFALALLAGGLSLVLQAKTPAPDGFGYVQTPSHPVAWFQSLGHSLGFYLGKALWPINLAPFYRHISPNPAQVADNIPTALSILAAAVLWRARKTAWRPVALAAAYYVVTLLPVVALGNLVSWKAAPRADHLQHLALIGVVALVAGTGTRWLPAQAWTVAGIALTGLLAALTWQQSTIYRDAITYWEAALRATPDQARVTYNLAVAYLEQRRYADAEQFLHQTIAIRPAHALAHFNLGLVYLATGRLYDASASFETAVRLIPHRAEFHYNLAKVLASQGRWADAVHHYETALMLPPRSPRLDIRASARQELIAARYNYGVVLARNQRWSEAEEQFRTVVTAQPGHVAAHYNLAIVLLQQQRPREALPHLETAARLNPADRDAVRLLTELRQKLQSTAND